MDYYKFSYNFPVVSRIVEYYDGKLYQQCFGIRNDEIKGKKIAELIHVTKIIKAILECANNAKNCFTINIITTEKIFSKLNY